MPPTRHFATHPIARFESHGGPVHALTFSGGTGQYILTGCQDRNIRLFNPSTRRLVQTYSAHGYEVLDLAVSEDNARFVSVGGDKTVFLWDVSTAQTLRRFNGHAGRINAVAFGGEDESVVVSGSFDGTVRVWDCRASSTRPIVTLSEAKDAVSTVAVRGHEIYAGSVDGRVRVYDIAMGHIDTDNVAPGKGVTSVVTAQAGDSYLASSLDSTIRFMDRRSGKCLQKYQDRSFTNETYRIRSTLAMADAYALSGSEDGRIVAWDILSGDVVARLWHKEGGDNRPVPADKREVVSVVAWNRMRKTWASASGDGSVVVWATDLNE